MEEVEKCIVLVKVTHFCWALSMEIWGYAPARIKDKNKTGSKWQFYIIYRGTTSLCDNES